MHAKIKKPGRVIPPLVVIGFMVFFFVAWILIAILIPAINGLIVTANRAKNEASMIDIKTAILAYNTDYGNLPIPTGAKLLPGGDVVLGTPPGADPSNPPAPGTKEFFQSLCGNMNSYSATATSFSITGVNRRNIAYLALQKGQVDKDGILLQSFGSLSSPRYVGIMLDANLDGELHGLPDCSTGTFKLTIKDSAALWSNSDLPYTTPNPRWATTY